MHDFGCLIWRSTRDSACARLVTKASVARYVGRIFRVWDMGFKPLGSAIRVSGLGPRV